MPPTIAGRVIDNNRRPVGKVKISLKGKVVAESEKDGSFSAPLPKAEGRIALTFTADGYVPNTRAYNSRPGNGNTIVVWPFAYRVKFDPARDLDIELGGSRIQIPAGALGGNGGAKTNGTAALRFTLFDITDPFQRAAASGDFTGRLRDRTIRRLNSYGIFDAALLDTKGRALALRRGAKIDLAIAIPPRLAGNSPRQVGFFNFDTSQGLWDQVGGFEFVPSTLTYNGSVTSFGGAHNLDDPQDNVCVTIKVEDWLGNAMPNANVIAHGAQYDSMGTTDASGFVCILVQKNASFWAEASGVTTGNTYFTSFPFGQQNFMSPNFSSGINNCGDPQLCPFVGTVIVDYAVGTGDLLVARRAGRA